MSVPFLLFQLYGPLASWGDIAVGEVRPSADRPSKSALLGLVAAALGLRREQEDDHRRLAASLRFACRLDHAGTYLHDYHTVQIPEGKGARGLATRADELAYDNVGTLLSYRDYYADVRAVACLWETPGVERYQPLEAFADHLRRPCFQLYLGRKACPPALPLMPYVDEEAENWKDALDRAAARYRLRLDCLLGHPQHLERATAPLQDDPVRYFWEGDDHAGLDDHRMEVERWDTPGSRTHWQFRPRREHMTTL